MITPEEAKELCIKAHAGQWRREKLLTKDDYSYVNKHLKKKIYLLLKDSIFFYPMEEYL